VRSRRHVSLDHDDVRVLAQDGTKSVGEGQAGFCVDLNLVDPVQFVFPGSSTVMMLMSGLFTSLSSE
jgi:hypothetical protein